MRAPCNLIRLTSALPSISKHERVISALDGGAMVY